MKVQTFKLGVSAVFAAIAGMYSELAVPFFVLCALMITDYITGMVKSWQKGTLCSKTGIKGFVKKLCYGLAVVAATGVDYVIITLSKSFGYNLKIQPFFALLCVVWLIINECISILENLTEIGVPMPAFLIKIAKRLKNSVEDKGDKEGDKHNDKI